MQELQDLLEKQRRAFAEESRRLLDFKDFCETHETSEETCEEAQSDLRKARAELVLRDVRISELTTQNESLELEVEALRPLTDQLRQLKELHSVAKQTAMSAEEKLHSAKSALSETISLKKKAEEECREHKQLTTTLQSQVKHAASARDKWHAEVQEMR